MIQVAELKALVSIELPMQPSLSWFRTKEAQLKAISEVISHYCSCSNCAEYKLEALEVLMYIAEQEYILRDNYKCYFGMTMEPLIPFRFA